MNRSTARVKGGVKILRAMKDVRPRDTCDRSPGAMSGCSTILRKLRPYAIAKLNAAPATTAAKLKAARPAKRVNAGSEDPFIAWNSPKNQNVGIQAKRVCTNDSRSPGSVGTGGSRKYIPTIRNK